MSKLQRDKIDAHKALYDFRQPRELPLTTDPLAVINRAEQARGEATDKVSAIPVLISEGFRNVLSVDTGVHNSVFLQKSALGLTNSELFSAKIVGLMSKVGYSDFTARKVMYSGKAMQTTTDHYSLILNELIAKDPALKTKLDLLNA